MSDVADELEAIGDESDVIDVEVGDRGEGVATVTIDRPDARNALNTAVREGITEVCDAVEAAHGDPDAVRVLVLTGSDEAGAFVAGADVTELRERGSVEMRRASKRPRIHERVDGLPIPVIARINGFCLGGGCELAQACDVRIASEDARLGQPETNLGIIPGGGATQRLPRLVGEGQAMKLILSGELIDAEEARSIGLVEEVPGDVDERVNELAGRMAAKSPLALEHAKTAVRAASRMDLADGIEYEAELFAALFDTHDKNEGIDAFLEDRDPEWEGR
ncbi:3-hydroxybutyryl-CoA dehydratase [Halobacteriales archaeon QS_8_69_26]|nr:MAG: 3-hydroxybutyryl-CoA dehydratase [Halobacteriales archaeon QS_8_69_26]